MHLFLSGLLATSLVASAAPNGEGTAELRRQAPFATHKTARSAQAIGQCLVDNLPFVGRVSILRHGERDTLTIDDGGELKMLVDVDQGTAAFRGTTSSGDAVLASIKKCV